MTPARDHLQAPVQGRAPRPRRHDHRRRARHPRGRRIDRPGRVGAARDPRRRAGTDHEHRRRRRLSAPPAGSPGRRRPIDCVPATPRHEVTCSSTSTSSTRSCWWGLPSPSPRSSPCGSRAAPGCLSLLIYLLMGVALGEAGRRHRVRERRGRARPRVRRAGGHPDRGRSHHELARGAALDAARAVAGHARRRHLGRRSSPSARTTCSACRGSSPSSSAPCARRPTRRRCSRCCGWCRCRSGWSARSRPSRVSTTPRPSCSSR